LLQNWHAPQASLHHIHKGGSSASDLTWQVAGGVDYKFTKNMILNAGYRYVDLDYSRGSGSDEFGIRLKAQGPVLGLTILF